MTEVFRGVPEVGGEEQAFLLVTAGDDGWPHVCLLSRAEIEASDGDPAEVRLVVRSRRTRAHLAGPGSSGRALLFAVVDGAARKWQLRVARTVDAGDAMAAALTVESAEDDRFPGVDLRPLHYTVPASLPSNERWTTSAALLDRLS